MLVGEVCSTNVQLTYLWWTSPEHSQDSGDEQCDKKHLCHVPSKLVFQRARHIIRDIINQMDQLDCWRQMRPQRLRLVSECLWQIYRRYIADISHGEWLYRQPAIVDSWWFQNLFQRLKPNRLQFHCVFHDFYCALPGSSLRVIQMEMICIWLYHY